MRPLYFRDELLKWLIGLLGALYPLLVYFGLMRYSPATLGVLIVAVAVSRIAFVEPQARRSMMPLAALLLAYAVAVVLTDSELLLRFYPVTMNLVFLCWFAYTLLHGPSAIERMVRLAGIEIGPNGPAYLGLVTVAWCIFFAANALVSAYTALLTNLETWALYNGLLAYVFMGLMFAGEWGVRQVYIRRVGM